MFRRTMLSRCAAAATAAPVKPTVTIPAGSQVELDKIVEAIPIIGAPLNALKSAGTFEELKEIRATSSDPAAQVTTNFIENQKKLVAWRLHRTRLEWLEFLDSPTPSGLSSVLIFARTIVLSALAYSFGYYFAAGFGVELPGVGMLFGEPAEVPKVLPWEGKK